MLQVDPRRKRRVPAWIQILIVASLMGLVGLWFLRSPGGWRGARSVDQATPPATATGSATTTPLTPTPLPSPTEAPTNTPLPPSATPSATHTLAPTLTATPVETPTVPATHTPAPTATHTPATTGVQTATSTPLVPTSTPPSTSTPTAAPLPSPTPRWLAAPRLLAPSDGEIFVGWNAEVILRWTPVAGVGENEYYVVSIPYDDAGGVAAFWRQETRVKLPAHLSLREVGFRDRHYAWSVQVVRCTENCDQVLNDLVPKQGIAVGSRSIKGLFYWQPDFGRRLPTPTPTPSPSPTPDL